MWIERVNCKIPCSIETIDDHSSSSLIMPASTQDRSQGALGAAVVLVMYGDYQCPKSAAVYKLIKVVRQELSVSFGEDYSCFIFRHFPQIQIHPQSQRAAQAAEAAAAQGQFWQMHDSLFDHHQALGNGYLVEYADRLGLDIPQFLQQFPQQKHLDRINADIESGIRSGVTDAPALFINNIRYTGRWKMTELMAATIALI
jgi:protein-disulfide isomerase